MRQGRKVGPLPSLEAGQVYVMKSGWVFHNRSCQIVYRTWDFNPGGLLVADLEAAAGRRLCASCSAAGT